MSIHSVPEDLSESERKPLYITQCQENLKSKANIPDTLNAVLAGSMVFIGAIFLATADYSSEPESDGYEDLFEKAAGRILLTIGGLTMGLTVPSLYYYDRHVSRCEAYLERIEVHSPPTNAPPAAVTPKPVKPSLPSAAPESEPSPVTAPTTP